MSNNIRKTIKYDSLIPSEKYLQSMSELISNKADDIHAQLYQIALDKWLADHEEYREGHTIRELKTKDLTEAPSILIVSNKWPFNRKTESLREYWDNSFFNINSSSWEDVYIDEESMTDAEIVHIDYVNGKVKMESKLTGHSFYMPFNRVNGDTPINEEKCTIIGTFTYMINNR